MTSIADSSAAALVTAAVAEASGRGVGISVAVVDDAGSLVAFHRMTPAPRFSADFAIAKARTSATFSVPTSSLEDLYRERPAFAHSFVAQGNYFLGRGGIPIFSGGERIGAIGVSGADAHGEEDIAVTVISAADGLELA
ncbi:MAG TPA: heme-binding protein [Frankiaceae bacterium]|nr:heme-binding protein [Frankiaceae bacterium]